MIFYVIFFKLSMLMIFIIMYVIKVESEINFFAKLMKYRLINNLFVVMYLINLLIFYFNLF